MNINVEKLKLKHQIPPQTNTLTYDSVESLSVSFGQLYKIPYLWFLFPSSLSLVSCRTVVPLNKIPVRFRIDYVLQHCYSAKRKKVNKSVKNENVVKCHGCYVMKWTKWIICCMMVYKYIHFFDTHRKSQFI